METNTEIDPLAVPAGDVDTSIPRLAPDKLYNMEITAAESKVNNDGVGMIRLTLKTTKDESDSTGKLLNKGFPVFENWVYTPTGDLTVDMIKRSGAGIMKALGRGTEPLSVLRDDPGSNVGKIVCVKIGTRKASGGYPESSVVRTWVELK